jgi:hypothetical protein
LTTLIVARSLGIAAEIKIVGETSLVFSDLWFGTYLRPPNVQDYVMEEERFKDLKDLLVSFGLYFVIVEVRSYISTMYYLLL